MTADIKSLMERLEETEALFCEGQVLVSADTAASLLKLHHDCKAALAPLAEPSLWQIALMSLTAGGSEFTSPDACVAYVRQVRNSQHETIVMFKKERDAATARADTAQKEVNELNDVLRAAGWGQGEIDSAAEMLYELEQRAEASERDARRYRWLRAEMNGDTWAMHAQGWIAPASADEETCIEPDTLDAAIDTALDAEGKERHD